MRYNNINPLLTNELIESAGFQFDGYYYSYANCHVRLLKSENGYEPIIDGNSEKFPTLTKYSQFIQLMMGLCNGLVGSLASQINYEVTNSELATKVIKVLEDFWKFDKDIRFALNILVNNTFTIVPDNVYTASLIDGDIHDYPISFIKDGNKTSVTIQCSPKFMTFDYANEVISSILGIKNLNSQIIFNII